MIVIPIEAPAQVYKGLEKKNGGNRNQRNNRDHPATSLLK